MLAARPNSVHLSVKRVQGTNQRSRVGHADESVPERLKTLADQESVPDPMTR
jgi:hypothetical protein